MSSTPNGHSDPRGLLPPRQETVAGGLLRQAPREARQHSEMGQELFSQIEKNSEEQVQFLQKLVQAKSSNPYTALDSSPDEPIEKDVAYIIADKLNDIGLKPRLVGMSEQRPNVVAVLGGDRKRSLILNGHMDTVSPPTGYSFDPYSGFVKENRLYGVGALDMKSSLCTYIFAAKAILETATPLNGSLILTFVVDEEPGACSRFGTHYLLANGLKGTSAIIGEPDSDTIGVGHRGIYRFRITTFGEAVHTGASVWEQRTKGWNAIQDMIQIVHGLANLQIPYKPSEMFIGKKPVFTFPTIIRGGENINVVPDRCVAFGDVRLLPSNSVKQVKLLLQEKLEESKRLYGIQYKLEDLVDIPPVVISPSEEIVRVLQKSAREVLGFEPKLEGVGHSNDAWMFIEQGIPCITGFGCRGDGAHSKDEWVDLNSLVAVTKVYARCIVDYLK